MSVDYASLLSEYDNKGVCGLSEVRQVLYCSILYCLHMYSPSPHPLTSTPHTHTLHIPHLQEFDPPDKLTEKISLLCKMLSSKKHVVVHTGAGVSTAAGSN